MLRNTIREKECIVAGLLLITIITPKYFLETCEVPFIKIILPALACGDCFIQFVAQLEFGVQVLGVFYEPPGPFYGLPGSTINVGSGKKSLLPFPIHCHTMVVV